MSCRLVFKGNAGSVRVFEKSGFVLEKTVDHEVISSSGEMQHGVTYLAVLFESPWRS